MKLFIHFLAAILPALAGCIIPEKVETRVRFNNDETPPQVTIIWHNISSAAKNDEELKKDFDNFIKDLNDEDSTLADAIGARGDGLFVKDWHIYIEKGKLHLRMSGVPVHDKFEDLDSDGERMLVVDRGDSEALLEETNGEIFKTEHNFIIVWPEKWKEFYMIQRFVDPEQRWDDTAAQKRWEQNRPKLIRMFEAYKQTGN